MSERIHRLELRCLSEETLHKEKNIETIRLARCAFNHFEKEKQRLERLLQDADDLFEQSTYIMYTCT